jgi:hypothetical protein
MRRYRGTMMIWPGIIIVAMIVQKRRPFAQKSFFANAYPARELRKS